MGNQTRTTLFPRLIAAAAGQALLLSMVLGSAPPTIQARGQDLPDTPASFDVIAIHPIDPAILTFRPPGTPPLAGMSDIYFLRAGGALHAPAISAKNLIAAAFDVKPWQVVSDADWLTTARFAIDAKTSTEMSRETLVAQAPTLMQALLADRFRLKARRERRPFPVFALMTARQDQRLGPQLRRSDADCDAQRTNSAPPSAIPPAPSPTRRPACGVTRWPGGMIAGAITMESLANALTGAVGSEQIVVDRTNLAGRFDVDLAWAPDSLRTSGSSAMPGAPLPDDAVTLSTALQEQLGLKLVRRREPIDVVVVDFIERPAAN